jgi:hypothetical protein
MNSPIRFGVSLCVVVVAEILSLGSALAVPSSTIAWSSQEYGVTVFRDELDTELYWFVPKIRFEEKNGKIALRAKSLANGKVEYSPRIIPYFPDSLRDLVEQNLPNIRLQSQLRPVVAKNIGVSLPDFDFRTTSATVTSYEYLDVPRLVRFQLDPEEAKFFDELYSDPLGVTVEFTVSYDGVTTDKFYTIDVSCKEMKRSLEFGTKKGTGVGAQVSEGVHLGVELESAFKNVVQNYNGGVDIISKGDTEGMAEILTRVMDVCFEPAAIDYGNGRDDDYEPDGADDSGLLTKVKLKARFKFKSSVENSDEAVAVKNVTMKDSVSTAVVIGTLSQFAKVEEKIKTKVFDQRSIVLNSTATAVTPFKTGIQIRAGEQYTINAEYRLLTPVAKTRPVNTGGASKPYPLDSFLGRFDEHLYFRIGSGKWKSVNRHLLIASDVASGGGELQFYIDSAAISGKISEKSKNSGWGGAKRIVIEPEYTVEINGREIAIQ